MKHIIFVYNAKSDFFHSLKDLLHKVLFLGTYPCKLCFLTYGVLNMKPKWGKFIESLPIQANFYHKDEFEYMYPDNKDVLPATFVKDDKGISLLISAKEINQCNTLEGLILLVKNKVSEIK